MEKTEKTASAADRFIGIEGINRFSERLTIAMGGMTNVELADLCGLSEATVRNYRKGKNYPPLDKIPLIAQACGCSLEWLVTGRNDEEKKTENEINCEFEVVISQTLSALSVEEKELVLRFIRREGTNNLVRLAAMNTSTISPDAVESIIDVLPLRPVLKNAIKIGLAGSEATDKEILCFIERHNASDNATQHAGAVSSGHKKSAS
ncbi:TPA_asm: helix-turn-helix transcriptional regulator [Salmonella enterica subsp. salamae serovar 18:z10:z6]|uniref:Helix-turn-helix transcriptional regulator n=1 Tax=Salmonella enterica subsp. salamae serovar 18:z10:z6 TaxID=1967614 RepID=A0A732CZB1_SALER|nr:helix-turn-helix transcriptional regulator [Salmonella enterica subsp. salamae serovar 18:z10:z6]